MGLLSRIPESVAFPLIVYGGPLLVISAIATALLAWLVGGK